jgi:hypothetical protein
MIALIFRCLLVLVLVSGVAADSLLPLPPKPVIVSVGSSEVVDGFIQDRCRLLIHHRRQLEVDSSRIADEELAPIFKDMDGRIEAFADWAFRWRTSYSLLRRITLGGLSAAVHGESLPDRVRDERDGMVEEAFRSLVILDSEERINAAAARWRERLGRSVDEVDRDHRTAVAMYLGFDPALGTPHPFVFLPRSDDGIKASDSARVFATTRLARPALVRGGTRAGAVILPDVVVGTALLSSGAGSVVGLLGLDYLVSRIDDYASREAFVAEIRNALVGIRLFTRDSWTAAGRHDIARILEERRDMLAAIGGAGGCPTVSAAAPPIDTAP